jgi:hypothetical protein
MLAACAGKRGPEVFPRDERRESSLPSTFVVGSGTGLQLFFHGLCAFVLPKATTDPLRVAMLNGYPDDADHRHVASLVVPRDGVDLAASTARPSAIDSDHIIYGLNDLSMTLKIDKVSKPGVKVKKTAVGPGCAVDGNWSDFGWVLDMSKFASFASGSRREWSKVGDVSQAQFETSHGSLEQDFDGKEQKSPVDKVEWVIGGTDRVVKQAARLRVLEAEISLELKPRVGTGSSLIVLKTKTGTVNAAIMNLPAMLKMRANPGTRLTDALAYYQMLDPSPLGKGNDDTLAVPLWSRNPHGCSTIHSIECSCCPPSEV